MIFTKFPHIIVISGGELPNVQRVRETPPGDHQRGRELQLQPGPQRADDGPHQQQEKEQPRHHQPQLQRARPLETLLQVRPGHNQSYSQLRMFQVQQVQEVPEDEEQGGEVPTVAEGQDEADRDAGDSGDQPFSLGGAGIMMILIQPKICFPIFSKPEKCCYPLSHSCQPTLQM